MQQPEPLNFEEIFARMKEELISRDKSFTALIESDPAMKILEVAAWRELFLSSPALAVTHGSQSVINSPTFILTLAFS